MVFRLYSHISANHATQVESGHVCLGADFQLLWSDISALACTPRGSFPACHCAQLFACALILLHIFRPAIRGIWVTAVSRERRSWPQWRGCRGSACTDVHTHSRIWDPDLLGWTSINGSSVLVCVCVFVCDWCCRRVCGYLGLKKKSLTFQLKFYFFGLGRQVGREQHNQGATAVHTSRDSFFIEARIWN